MHIIQLTYAESEGRPQYWRLFPLDFQQINLIVGRNASGKTRTLNVINSLARCLSGTQVVTEGHFHAKFANRDGIISEYELSCCGSEVVLERFVADGKVLMQRGAGGVGKIWAEQFNADMDFQLPQKLLAATTRNDSVQHPFFGPLIEWATGLFHYPCTSDLGKSTVLVPRPDAPPIDFKDANQTAAILKTAIERYGQDFVADIISDMREIGYSLSDVGTAAPVTYNLASLLDPLTIYVIEDGVGGAIDQFSMSVGMFRAMAIVIHLNFGIRSAAAKSILIDDIGEGLDFDRSQGLIKLIVRKLALSDLQLIMTTNDRYVMNGIPLEYWSVLHRTGPEVEGLNERNRPEQFEDFRFTGLSNFDFLARDFLSEDDE